MDPHVFRHLHVFRHFHDLLFGQAWQNDLGLAAYFVAGGRMARSWGYAWVRVVVGLGDAALPGVLRRVALLESSALPAASVLVEWLTRSVVFLMRTSSLDMLSVSFTCRSARRGT